jgi:putative transposase
MTSIPQRNQILSMVAEAVAAGARQERACTAISLSERTLQRWQKDQAAGAGDRRPARVQTPKNRLSEIERRQVLTIANSPEFGHLPPSQIVPRLADQGKHPAIPS